MYKDILKFCISAALAAAMSAFCSAAYADTGSEARRLFELDLSGVPYESTAIPGGKALNGGAAVSYSVKNVGSEVSETEKAAYAKTYESEIYFDLSEAIEVSDVTEDTDYFIRVKLYAAETSQTDEMQLKTVFLNSADMSKRIGFIGLQANKLMFTNKRISVGQWYNLLIRLHASPDINAVYLGEKLWSVGEAEPENWDIIAYSGSISTHYDISKITDTVGIKCWRQSGCMFTDYSVWAYNAAAAQEYDELREKITDISGQIESGAITLSEAREQIDEAGARIDKMQGSIQELARNAKAPIDAALAAAENVGSELLALLEEKITGENLFEAYARAEQIRAEAAELKFSDERIRICSELDRWMTVELTPSYAALTAKDEMLYESGEQMSATEADEQNGWADGWKVYGAAAYDGGLCIDGTAARVMKSEVNTDIQCEYAAELSKVVLNNGGFEASIGDISFGARYVDGEYYPYVEDIQGGRSVSGGNFLLRITNDNPRKAELYVYDDKNVPSKEPDVSTELDDAHGGNVMSITADGSIFGSVAKEVYPKAYALSEKNIIFETAEEAADDKQTLEDKQKRLDELTDGIDALRRGAYYNYLNAVITACSDEVIIKRLDVHFAELEAETTTQAIADAQLLIDKINDTGKSAEYTAKLKEYRSRLSGITPIIVSVGIEGSIKAGAAVRAKAEINDTAGNGGGYDVEWLVGGTVKGTEEQFLIPENAAKKTLILRVIPKNTDGIKGASVSTAAVSIAGGSSSGVYSGGGGGSGGGISIGTAPAVSNTLPPQETQEPFKTGFIDIDGHWAKEYIESLTARGIVSGVDERHFEPDREVSRAEFTRLLTAAVGIEAIEYNGEFQDVSGTEWYAGYAAAAFSKGVVSGSDGKFLPDDKITREQAVQMLVSVWRMYFSDINRENTDRFTDCESISRWAIDAVETALGAGLVSGISDTEFAPLAKTTRAEAAVMVNRLITCLGF